jgi:hypothetical protein
MSEPGKKAGDEVSRCPHCGEPVVAEERSSPEPTLTVWGDMHRECAHRSILGSVAHIERRCSCYVPGSTESDPPGMTVREAARAAVRAWRLREARN